jgi:hypothetical protein
MKNGIHITLTINLKDGSEIADIEGEAPAFGVIPMVVEHMIAEQGVKEDEWSSLVIVVVQK